MVRNQRLATAGRNHRRDTGGGGVTRSGHVFGRSWRHRAHEDTDGDAAGERQRRQRLLLSSSPSISYQRLPSATLALKQQVRAPGTCRFLWCKAEQGKTNRGGLAPWWPGANPLSLSVLASSLVIWGEQCLSCLLWDLHEIKYLQKLQKACMQM